MVSEFVRRDQEWMNHDLVSALRARCRIDAVSHLHGIFARYRPGGFGFTRLMNLVWVYIRVPAHLAVRRPSLVIVRTTPPLVQLWTVVWATILRIPVVCWLMDYHPEIEARGCESRGWRVAARLLRRIDRDLMRRFELVIALDDSMAAAVRRQAPGVSIIVHPTWGGTRCTRPASVRPKAGVRRLVYAGNLGIAHSVSTFSSVLAQLCKGGGVELHVIGGSAAGTPKFKKLAQEAGIRLFLHRRVPFETLAEEFERQQADLGVVLLSDEAAGVVSPSKFAAYLMCGLPLLYIGPEDTNADVACRRFGAGWRLPNHAEVECIERVAQGIWSTGDHAAKQCRVVQADRYFAECDAAMLASRLVAVLPVLQAAAVDGASTNGAVVRTVPPSKPQLTVQPQVESRTTST